MPARVHRLQLKRSRSARRTETSRAAVDQENSISLRLTLSPLRQSQGRLLSLSNSYACLSCLKRKASYPPISRAVDIFFLQKLRKHSSNPMQKSLHFL